MARKATQDSISGETESDQDEGDARVAELLKVNGSLDKVDTFALDPRATALTNTSHSGSRKHW